MKNIMGLILAFMLLVLCYGCVVVSSRGYDSGDRWDRDSGERKDYDNRGRH